MTKFCTTPNTPLPASLRFSVILSWVTFAGLLVQVPFNLDAPLPLLLLIGLLLITLAYIALGIVARKNSTRLFLLTLSAGLFVCNLGAPIIATFLFRTLWPPDLHFFPSAVPILFFIGGSASLGVLGTQSLIRELRSDHIRSCFISGDVVNQRLREKVALGLGGFIASVFLLFLLFGF